MLQTTEKEGKLSILLKRLEHRLYTLYSNSIDTLETWSQYTPVMYDYVCIICMNVTYMSFVFPLIILGFALFSNDTNLSFSQILTSEVNIS